MMGELEKLAREVKRIAPYVSATLMTADSFPSDGDEEWGEVHRGRAASSVRQLNQLEAHADALLEADDD